MSNELKWENTKNYSIDIRTVNPYVFCTNCYNGDGGFFDGSYLMKFARESFYDERKKYSFYRNYTKPIINAMVDPVFSKNIIRTTSNDMFESFLQDVDNKQSGINQFTQNVMIYTRLHGVNFVVMDNFDTIETVKTRSEAIDTRTYPYVYIMPAYNVSDFKLDYFKNLIEITFKTKDKVEGKEYDLYTTWNFMDTIRVWKFEDKIVKSTVHTHGLGILPVISVYSDGNEDVLPLPPWYDVCKLNLGIYNKDSEVREQERTQAFSIFYMQSDTNNNSITLGSSNALILPAGSDITIPPGYISPDPAILSTLISNTDKLITSIYEIAGQNGIIGVKSAKSGIAASYEFISTKDQLLKTCNIAKDFELKLAELFGKYVNETIDYTVVYPTKFDNIISKDFNTMKEMLNISTSDDIKIEIKKIMVSEILESLDNERLQILLDGIKADVKIPPIETIINTNELV